MASYQITSPDGATYQITAPDTATQDEVLSYAQQNHAQQAAPVQNQSYISNNLKSTMSDVGQQLSRPIDPNLSLPGQLLEKGLAIGAAPARLGGAIAGGALQTLNDHVPSWIKGDQQAPVSDMNPFSLAGQFSANANMAYQNFKQGHPQTAQAVDRLGEDVGNLINTAPVLPVINSGAQEVSNTVGDIAQGAKGLNFEDIRNEADTLRSKYAPQYNEVKNNNIGVDQTKNLVDNINNNLASHDLDPDLHPGTLKVLQRIQTESGDGADLTVNKVNTYKKLLENVAQKDTNSIGRMGEDGAAAMAAKSAINDTLTNIPELQSANADYGAGSKFNRLADIVQKNNGDINGIQKDIKRIVGNNKKLYGYDDSEVASMRKFANGSLTENMVGLLSKAGFDFGNLRGAGNVVRGLVEGGGSVLAPTVGLPIAAVGTAARLGYNAAKRGQFRNLLDQVKQNAEMRK